MEGIAVRNEGLCAGRQGNAKRQTGKEEMRIFWRGFISLGKGDFAANVIPSREHKCLIAMPLFIKAPSAVNCQAPWFASVLNWVTVVVCKELTSCH